MGSCLSRKSTSSCSPAALPNPLLDQPKSANSTLQLEKIQNQHPQEESLKKEIFFIKHRKSHDVDTRSKEEAIIGAEEITEVVEKSKDPNGIIGAPAAVAAAPVRTSSCTKEEVDAILIQCGRLSRSSSTEKANLSSGDKDNSGTIGSRKNRYSGVKRSYDFESENVKKIENSNGDDFVVEANGEENGVASGERSHRHRQRHRGSLPSSNSQGRRRTPSRERESNQGVSPQQRSSSRERGTKGGGRRVSRSPGRRSESPITASGDVSGHSASGNAGVARPGKLVSVPATALMDKSNNGGNGVVEAAAIKRIQVKRNVGEGAAAAAVGSRSAASPRARSPARANGRGLSENQNAQSNQNQQQGLTLSRSNSRKAEQSPNRRSPLGEIDTNVIGFGQQVLPGHKAVNNNIQYQAVMQKQNVESANNKKVVHEIENVEHANCRSKDMQHQQEEAKGGVQQANTNVAVTLVASEGESLKPQALTRSRSSRRSKDLDINPEAILNPTQSYTALLLEDIQNFHQKSVPDPAFTLPACVSKACSILEAVADLNSSTSSNLSGAFTEDRKRNAAAEPHSKNDDKNSAFGAHPAGKKALDAKDPFIETEVVVNDDLLEPSIQKYVTFRRGTMEGRDMEDQESSGSNSFACGQQHWVSSSSWEPNSADSTDRWTTSKTNATEDEQSPLSYQRHAFSGSGQMDDSQTRSKKRDSDHQDDSQTRSKKRDSDHQRTGIGRGRISPNGVLGPIRTAAAAST